MLYIEGNECGVELNDYEDMTDRQRQVMIDGIGWSHKSAVRPADCDDSTISGLLPTSL